LHKSAKFSHIKYSFAKKNDSLAMGINVCDLVMVRRSVVRGIKHLPTLQNSSALFLNAKFSWSYIAIIQCFVENKIPEE